MKKAIVKLTLLLVILALSSCRSSNPVTVTRVTHLEPGHSRQGFYYALPRNVVVIDVTVLKTEQTPGPFAQFAGRLLGIEGVITEPVTRYNLFDISLDTYAEADPGNFFFAELDPRTHKDNSFSVSLTESGLIYAINNPWKYPGELRTELSAMHAFFGEGNNLVSPAVPELPGLRENIPGATSQIDTLSVERRAMRRTWVERTSEVKARETVEKIENIRNKRFELISGFAEITYSKEALEYMNEQLKKMENEYLELFTGSTEKSMVRYRFYYLPTLIQAGETTTLFHFSTTGGVTSSPHARSAPVQITASRDLATQQMSVFTMSPTTQKPVDRGFYYRIPEFGKVVINKEEVTLAEKRMLISQFGVITSLPPDDLRILFHPNTGAIRSMERVR